MTCAAWAFKSAASQLSTFHPILSVTSCFMWLSWEKLIFRQDVYGLELIINDRPCCWYLMYIVQTSNSDLFFLLPRSLTLDYSFSQIRSLTLAAWISKFVWNDNKHTTIHAVTRLDLLSVLTQLLFIAYVPTSQCTSSFEIFYPISDLDCLGMIPSENNVAVCYNFVTYSGCLRKLI